MPVSTGNGQNFEARAVDRPPGSRTCAAQHLGHQRRRQAERFVRGCVASSWRRKGRLIAVPTAAGFRQWQQDLHIQVCAASARSKSRALRWVQELEILVSIGTVEGPRRRWNELDTALAAAIVPIARGALQRELLLYQERQSRRGLRLFGRAALRIAEAREQVRGQLDVSGVGRQEEPRRFRCRLGWGEACSTAAGRVELGGACRHGFRTSPSNNTPRRDSERTRWRRPEAEQLVHVEGLVQVRGEVQVCARRRQRGSRTRTAHSTIDRNDQNKPAGDQTERSRADLMLGRVPA